MEIKQYRGLKAIAERLGCRDRTVQRLIRDDGLLAYKVRTGRGWEELWVTDDRLIELWQIARCRVAVAKLARRSKTSKAERIDSPATESTTPIRESKSISTDPNCPVDNSA